MPGSCNGYTLALAAGELAWIGVFFVFQAHFLKKLFLLLCRLLSLLRFCTRMGGICDVFNHTKMWEQVKVLEDQTILALDLF